MPSIEALKKSAKKIKKAKGISHHEALNQTAQEQGFKSWSILVKSKTNSETNKEMFRLIAEGNSIDNEYILSKINGPFYRIHMRDFMKELILALKNRNLEAFQNKYISINKTLIFEGFHHIKNKSFTQEKFSTIISKRTSRTIGLSLESYSFYFDETHGIVPDIKNLLFLNK